MTTLPSVVSEDVIAALDHASSNANLTVASQFKRAFATAEAIGQLKALLTPKIMEPIMNLQNSPLGFMTDRKDGYPVDTVRDCVIDAVLSGVSLVGNEFNILVGRTYITKNGMKHKVRKVDGLSRTLTPGIPKMSNDGKGAVVEMEIDWTFNGKENHKSINFAIRVNSGMGADAIIGKATRKADAWLYEAITGQTVDDGDVTDDGKVVETTAKESPIDNAPATSATADGELPM